MGFVFVLVAIWLKEVIVDRRALARKKRVLRRALVEHSVTDDFDRLRWACERVLEGTGVGWQGSTIGAPARIAEQLAELDEENAIVYLRLTGTLSLLDSAAEKLDSDLEEFIEATAEKRRELAGLVEGQAVSLGRTLLELSTVRLTLLRVLRDVSSSDDSALLGAEAEVANLNVEMARWEMAYFERVGHHRAHH